MHRRTRRTEDRIDELLITVLLAAGILFLSLLLGGCGTEETYYPEEAQIEAELLPYTDQFLLEMSSRGLWPLPGIDLPRDVGWRTQDEPMLGSCTTPDRVVQIQLGIRGGATSLIRAVVYHELAHCMYYVDHEPESGIMAAALDARDIDRWDSSQWTWQLDLLAAYIEATSPPIHRLRQEGYESGGDE